MLFHKANVEGPGVWGRSNVKCRSQLGMVELCEKNLQIMHNDFTDYARTFCQLCATILKIMRALFGVFANYAHFLPIMRTFHAKS